MALQFPNSPTNGQIYNDPLSGASFTYNSSIGAWETNGDATSMASYAGNFGRTGSTGGQNNIFRINTDTLTENVSISASENALAAGPITISLGRTLTVNTNGRVVII